MANALIGGLLDYSTTRLPDYKTNRLSRMGKGVNELSTEVYLSIMFPGKLIVEVVQQGLGRWVEDELG
ncbi:MAG: hypothetical protein M5U34_20600 [Chloroflexi bacterium]|nr:hypothetical protein [Chloroflexota bacterium]